MAKGIEDFKEVANFSPRPGTQLGAVDSAHGVFFGRLGREEVAVKPHSSAERARHEEKMLRVTGNSGLLALKPL